MTTTVRKFSPVMTFEVQGVTIGRTGTLKFDHAFKTASKSIYSIYVEHQTLYDIGKFKELITQLTAPITTSKSTDEAYEHYKQLIQGLDNNPYGVFLDFNKRLPFSFTCPPEYHYNPNGRKLQPTVEQKFVLDKLKSLQEVFQTLFDTLPTAISSKGTDRRSPAPLKEEQTTTIKSMDKMQKVVEKVEVKPEEPKVKKAKTKGEKIEEFIELISRDSRDFDTTKWDTSIVFAEQLLETLPKTIEALEADLAKKFDFATKARLVKRRKELEDLPAKIEIIKRNARAKQNYYTDNYHSSFNQFEILCNNQIGKDSNLEYSNYIERPNGANTFKGIFAPSTDKIHFARHPLFRFKLMEQISEFAKIVNRIRKNKEIQVANLAQLQAFLTEINTPQDTTKEYFVEFLEPNPL